MIELFYNNGVNLRTGDRAFREVNPRKRLTKQERDEHDAARLIADVFGEIEQSEHDGKIVVFDRNSKPKFVILTAEQWAALVEWLP